MRPYSAMLQKGSCAFRMVQLLAEDGAQTQYQLRKRLGLTASAFAEIRRRLFNRGLAQEFRKKGTVLQRDGRFLALTPRGLAEYESLVQDDEQVAQLEAAVC